MGRTLGARELNRASLARQFLLERAGRPVEEVVSHLAGLQAQTPHTWYVGLWSRVAGFDPGDVVEAMTARRLVRIAAMRSTIHLLTADDALFLRPLTQPALDRDLSGNFTHKKPLAGMDLEALVAAGREILEREPMTNKRLGELLAERWPDRKPASLAYAVRCLAPLVQVPPRGLWGRSGPIAHTTAEHWLGRPLDPAPSPERMVLRYLAAFGPASVMDVQKWCGLTRLGEVVDRMRGELVTFTDETGREVFDLPGAPRPDPDTPAPPRFLYDYDNVLISYAGRTRVVTDHVKRQNYDPHGPVPQFVLIDGFTGGDWRITGDKGSAVLTIRPFAPLTSADTEALTEEGLALLAFAEPRAESRDVRVTAPI
ncbi:winged helix DNA-binding domain-containing protein [Bailinhaonella thermotolerans]|uniref:winged helix DNA-binding domain-containing protein n=1 Tax=Bailinhaonella thermotolerans TaxID=1070861 RepID=UPI001F5B154C|nr:winged helix DNA-binding domain-containing protein [Bailinhaonella thermotolerans]